MKSEGSKRAGIIPAFNPCKLSKKESELVKMVLSDIARIDLGRKREQYEEEIKMLVCIAKRIQGEIDSAISEYNKTVNLIAKKVGDGVKVDYKLTKAEREGLTDLIAIRFVENNIRSFWTEISRI